MTRREMGLTGCITGFADFRDKCLRFLPLLHTSSKSQVRPICSPFAGNPFQQQQTFFFFTTQSSSIALQMKTILPCSPKRGSSLIKHIIELTFMTRQTLTGLDFDTKQIYGLTSILLEGGLVRISPSRWTPPCPGVASEPPQTADG